MLVTIVAVPNADNTGLDLDRLEKVEDLADEVARTMLQVGTAREPSDEELGAYEKARAKESDSDAYDNGGELPPGTTEAHNSTGQNEVIAAPERPQRAAKKAVAPVETAPVDGEPPTDSAPTDRSEGTAA